MPFKVTGAITGMLRSSDPNKDPVAAQFWPRPEESIIKEYETTDPLGDNLYKTASRVVHHYYDRMLLLVNDRCAAYCRYCFRRHFTGQEGSRITAEELSEACLFLKDHPQIDEVLITGGDPLSLSNSNIKDIISSLKDTKQELTVRIGTRVPIVMPKRIDEGLLRVMEEYGPIWMILHINHVQEITPDFIKAIGDLRKTGVQFLNQSVLLKGVNDDWQVLKTLYRRLLQLGIKPYYLFQGDLASGTSHFRVDIRKGLTIMEKLRQHLSGMGIPTYAVDLPQGGGKVPLTEDRISHEDDKWYYIKNLEGHIYPYPKEV